MARVSPTTRPGRSPAGRGSRTRRAVSASPSRSPPAARCSPPGRPSSVGGPWAETTATTSSPRRGADSTARTRTGCPGRRSRQASVGANRSTPESSRCVAAPAVRRVTVASATSRRPREPVSTCGTPSSSRSSTTIRSALATAPRGEASRSAPRIPAVAADTARPARTARATAVAGPFERRATAAARPVATRAPRASCAGVMSGAAALTAHIAPATGTRRRSTQSQRPVADLSAPPTALTRRPVPRAPRRWPDRCRARRPVARRTGTARCGCGGPRSAGRGRVRCRAARPARPRWRS